MKKSLSALLIFAATCAIGQTKKKYNVQYDEIKADVQPTMWGVFFEDINMGADGGIYAELVKNRSFEFYKPLMGWTIKRDKFNEGDILVVNRKDENTANPRYIRVKANNAVNGSLSLTNEGFRGMGVKKDLGYDFSVMYRQKSPGLKLHTELVDSTGKVIGAGELSPSETGDWKKQSISFKSNATVQKAKLNIWFEGSGEIDLDMISLFPQDTWKGRKGGFRSDMVQLLADMKPGFIRFPGGCIVEGHELSTRYQWKKTIGPIEERQLIINRWNTEFAHRPAPDYFQTFGLGFFEYFQLAEDIGAQPLPILNCGMACQFNTAEVAAIDELDPYVQDALDLIEFANDSTDTKWGKVRAEMGHPKPFNLKMMGVGNENWGPQYVERLKIFTKAIKDKYPDFKLVNSSGTDPDGERFDYLNTTLRGMKADIIDEHYYRRPEWFLQNASRYDNYPRNGSKIFAGEYAAQSDKTVSVDNKNTLQCAIAEAAFMTGLERNADVVNMASYAPLFAHIDGWQWTPDLIWVDNLNSYGTPDYYVQKLFSVNKGTQVVAMTGDGKAIAGTDGIFGSAVVDRKSKELIIKMVNSNASAQNAEISLGGKVKLSKNGVVTVLSADNLNQTNSFQAPKAVSPQDKAIKISGGKVSLAMTPNSFNVIKIKML
ncbi:alpha-L-arabinofuranosidase [Pedobacter sp. HMF7647]|uniref:non-reducing end alpha-L-arabinofuranosidase n=1 Tax=Hufsiella arboris TaxID=2695275 RepID=A0A7K1Y878_9SPHI|nr:alpha-L-arabinofuranosidase C-terminal domain-containing protein [Hufsiella arboris]MXV50777.1 alpha-L-arabinofuranosidase [Hufsiella arboris]